MKQNSIELLSKREVEITHHLTLGASQIEIADSLFVSPHTVRNHIASIFKKLNARCAVDVARTYILSLDNPRQILISYACIIIMGASVFSTDINDMRRARRTKIRTFKTQKLC